jgi:hypothetical protein
MNFGIQLIGSFVGNNSTFTLKKQKISTWEPLDTMIYSRILYLNKLSINDNLSWFNFCNWGESSSKSEFSFIKSNSSFSFVKLNSLKSKFRKCSGEELIFMLLNLSNTVILLLTITSLALFC